MATQVQTPVAAEPFRPQQWGPKAAGPGARMAAGRDYALVPLTVADVPRVLAFLKRFFFRDEPLNVAVCLLGEAGDQRCPELEEYCAQSLEQPYSLAAVSPAGELLGVCLNEVPETSPTSGEEALAKAATCPNQRFRKILRLLATLEAQLDMTRRFPDVRRVFEVRVLSVDGSRRGLGLGTALLERSREMAREQGVPLVRVDCTSAFSAKAVARLGMQPISEIRYDQHLDEDGRPVFRPEAPHDRVVCYVQRL